MIPHSTRYLTSGERAANRTKNPFHLLFRSDKWRERKEALVEIFEFRVEKAWLVAGCDRGVGCCSGSLLLRTPEKQFVYLTGTVSTSPEYDFRWASKYKKGQCDGDHVVIERWPRSKRIYSVRFSGAPVQHVWLENWGKRWRWPRLTVTGPCDIAYLDNPNDLPEE